MSQVAFQVNRYIRKTCIIGNAKGDYQQRFLICVGTELTCVKRFIEILSAKLNEKWVGT